MHNRRHSIHQAVLPIGVESRRRVVAPLALERRTITAQFVLLGSVSIAYALFVVLTIFVQAERTALTERTDENKRKLAALESQYIRDVRDVTISDAYERGFVGSHEKYFITSVTASNEASADAPEN
ncbi:MAG: hypothetical protein AAB573_03605 [Patescibacteria group bacterium]